MLTKDVILTICSLDFLWLNENVLVSCSKDCKLVQQMMSQAERPADKAVSREGGEESYIHVHGVDCIMRHQKCSI